MSAEFDFQIGNGACYIRVSTDHQDTSSQIASIERWEQQKSVQISEQFKFRDEGYSRDIPDKRPEFQRMIEAAEAGLLNWIVADQQDRFGTKDKYQFMSYMYRLRESGCHFFTVDGKCWTDDSMMSFMEGGFGAETSEKEQKDKSWRILRGRIPDAEQGKYTGGHVPYGMDVGCFDINNEEKWRVVIDGRELVGGDPNIKKKGNRKYSICRLKVWPDGKVETFEGEHNFPAMEKNDIPRLVPSKDERKLSAIREIFTRYATETVSPTQIAKLLNELGIKHHYAERWEHYHVREMLKNPIYIGRQRYNSNGQGRFFEFIDGEIKQVRCKTGRRERNKEDWIVSDQLLFEPLIPVDVWEAVQKRIEKTPREKRAPKSADLWLSGLLFCSHCGQPMRGMQRETRCEYFCSTYSKSKGNETCLRHGVNHNVLEEMVLNYVREAGDQGRLMLEVQQSEKLDLLKPFEETHKNNLYRFMDGFCDVVDSIKQHDDWMMMIQQVQSESPIILGGPADDDEVVCERVEQVMHVLDTVYNRYFSKDQEMLNERYQKLNEEHTTLTNRVLSFDPEKGSLAIEKANQRIESLESLMRELQQSMTNKSEQFKHTRDEIFGHVRAFNNAEFLLNDPKATTRRKAQAVRSCIKRINLTFRPTGKRYPTSELQNVEIIPLEVECRAEASYSQDTTLPESHSPPPTASPLDGATQSPAAPESPSTTLSSAFS